MLLCVSEHRKDILLIGVRQKVPLARQDTIQSRQLGLNGVKPPADDHAVLIGPPSGEIPEFVLLRQPSGFLHREALRPLEALKSLVGEDENRQNRLRVGRVISFRRLNVLFERGGHGHMPEPLGPPDCPPIDSEEPEVLGWDLQELREIVQHCGCLGFFSESVVHLFDEFDAGPVEGAHHLLDQVRAGELDHCVHRCFLSLLLFPLHLLLLSMNPLDQRWVHFLGQRFLEDLLRLLLLHIHQHVRVVGLHSPSS
mmetsp:Transcript_10115/g.19585  ORF Transcript_10115/g.19585 Transcript_10115/m.19585 type:complete len:254 (-) Transcript_10115:485-1246(-)